MVPKRSARRRHRGAARLPAGLRPIRRATPQARWPAATSLSAVAGGSPTRAGVAPADDREAANRSDGSTREAALWSVRSPRWSVWAGSGACAARPTRSSRRHRWSCSPTRGGAALIADIGVDSLRSAFAASSVTCRHRRLLRHAWSSGDGYVLPEHEGNSRCAAPLTTSIAWTRCKTLPATRSSSHASSACFPE